MNLHGGAEELWFVDAVVRLYDGWKDQADVSARLKYVLQNPFSVI
jgi:hypothetical protein